MRIFTFRFRPAVVSDLYVEFALDAQAAWNIARPLSARLRERERPSFVTGSDLLVDGGYAAV
jgi:hypothetical protein